ncbi:MAG: hypothetical protein ACXAC7_12745 [Candidatus Hodarchaeales archaeon]
MRYSQSIEIEEIESFLLEVVKSTPLYQKKYQNYPLKPLTKLNFENLPYLTSNDYYQMNNITDIYSDHQQGQYVFIRDGTNKINEIALWDSNYIINQTSQIAKGLNQLGLSETDRVLNLFKPGITGTHFLFNLALEQIGATIVPLGGETELPVIARFADDLQVNIILGETEFIFTSLDYMVKNKPELSLDTILYLGNPPTPDKYEFMKKHALKITSPFYFSIETGVIGTQCPFNPPNTFHSTKNVYIELINPKTNSLSDTNIGEVLITNLSNRASPCIRYQLGDNIKFLEKTCKCNNSLPLFILEGIRQNIDIDNHDNNN